jgi:hypothetical protein
MEFADHALEIVSKKNMINKHCVFLTIDGYNTQLIFILH